MSDPKKISTRLAYAHVMVRFQNSPDKEYCYFTDLTLEEGDLAVVHTPRGTWEVVQVAQVTGVSTYDKAKAKKWIVCRVDVADYQERIRRQEQARKIREELKARREAQDEIEAYKLLASNDPQAAELLRQLIQLEDMPVALPQETS